MEVVCNNTKILNDVVEILQTVNLDVEPEYKEYISLDMNLKQIKSILKNKNKVGRSFKGYEDIILKGLKDSKDLKLAVYNLNFLLNADDKQLEASDISAILAITENANNCSQGAAKYLYRRYRYSGGKLTEKSYNSIQVGRKADEIIKIRLLEMQKTMD